MHKIGIDLGGTKIEGIVLDGSLRPQGRIRLPTPGSYAGILDGIESLVDRLANGIPEYTVGVCAPGTISRISGTVQNSNTRCLAGTRLNKDLEERLCTSIALENDANCFAVAEATLGSGRGHHVVFGAIMGTGVGGGIAIDGAMYRGRTGIAGEWGHHILHPGGRRCYCGRSGCAEAYLSGPALEEEWHNITGKSERMPDILRHIGTDAGMRLKQRWLDDFGVGLANVVNVLDPDVIVLGGGLSNVDFLYTEGRDAVHANIFADHVDTPILRNQLGDSAGVFGAALLV